MSELSDEMKQELVKGVNEDCQAMIQRTQCMYTWSGSKNTLEIKHTDLEQLTYITEQMRLKLRLLGAPRIYQ